MNTEGVGDTVTEQLLRSQGEKIPGSQAQTETHLRTIWPGLGLGSLGVDEYDRMWGLTLMKCCGVSLAA
jgi:hypothetical protein